MFGHEDRRPRKLLVSKREMARLWNDTQRKGMTLVPLVLYFNHRGHREAEDRHRQGQEDRRQARDRRPSATGTARSSAC